MEEWVGSAFWNIFPKQWQKTIIYDQ